MNMNWAYSNGQSCLNNGVVTFGCIIPLVSRIIGVALGLAGTASLLLILAAGVKYITSGGGKAVDEAKNMLTYAILGLVVVLLAVFIVNIISYITGVHCLRTFGFTCGN
ncbi:MAG TPA: hypothetical protein VN711_01250 [Candidatus Saccharimonadales bacterium]|nr:hypothetical protein [Candidatus Saccharimonadales bacterium]